MFCSIVAGETEAAVVWRDDDLAAFLDARPVFKGHVLLVPRQHFETLPDLPARLRDPLPGGRPAAGPAMVDGLGAAGSFVAMNNTVSQSVPHLHCTSCRAPRATGCAASSGRARSTTSRRPGRLGRRPPH